MAYGIKYRCEFTSYTYSTEYKIEISEKDYIGAILEPLMQESPAFLKQDEADYVRGTSLDINLISEINLQYIELFTSDYQKYKVELYKKVSGTYIKIWLGYLAPEFYTEPWIAPPYPLQFTAMDSIGRLKDIKFSELGLIGRKSQLDIINHILLSISEIDKIEIYINWHAIGMNTARAGIAQAYVLADFYTSEGITCYDVLEDILKQYNAIIYQNNAHWIIQRKSGLSASISRFVYQLTSSGAVYSSTKGIEINTWNNDTNNKNLPLSLNMEVVAAYKQVEINVKLKPADVIYPGDFTKIENYYYYDANTIYPRNWTDPGNLLDGSLTDRDLNNLYLFFKGDNNKYIRSSKSLPLTPVAGQTLKLTLEGTINAPKNVTRSQYLKIRFITNSKTYYLYRYYYYDSTKWIINTSWQTSDSQVDIWWDGTKMEFSTHEIYFDLPGTEPGVLEMDMYGMLVYFIRLKRAEINFSNLSPRINSLININHAAINSLPTIDIKATDVKINGENNIAAAFENNLLDANNQDLTNWNGVSIGLLEALEIELNSYYYDSKFKLSGEILTENVNVEMIADTDTGKNFEILTKNCNLVYDKIDITLLELT